MRNSHQAKSEAERLTELYRYQILDTPAEPQFDDLAVLASQICQTPIALISLVDSERQWFKAKVGIDTTSMDTSRSIAFCDHAIRDPYAPMIVPDATLDQRFSHNPFVTGESNIRFYAGMPLTTPNGLPMGTLCVIDRVPRDLVSSQIDALKALARQAVSQLELRRNATENARLCADAFQTARRARHAALHDALTGLPNRAMFSEKVAACVERARTDAGHPFAVFFVDLNRLKIINDSLGHAAGDLLINTVARRLADALSSTSCVGVSHVLARFGGDEFMVLLEDVTDEAIVRDIVRTSLTAIGRPFHFGEQVIHPEANIGIVMGHAGYHDADEVLRDAEAALHHAKAAGHGKYATFNVKMHERAVKRLCLEGELRRAIDRGELILHYQPVVSLETQELIGFESLVRWQREGKLVSPADFIPVAEETGLIVPLGRWVIAEAVHQAAEWRRRYPELPPFKMAVNVSRRQLIDDDLVPHVRRLLRHSGLDPSCLMLEITESTVMGDADDARRVLSDLRAIGLKLAMDDFGTGYSSLSCLHEFDLDVLKVDRTFVASLHHHRESTVLKAVMSLAQGLGMKVVAEGIETPEQMAFLRSIHCDYGQGYLFAKPLPAKEAEVFLTRRMQVAMSA